MLAEGKGPINFTVFLALFGEKLNGMTKPDFLKTENNILGFTCFTLLAVVHSFSEASILI